MIQNIFTITSFSPVNTLTRTRGFSLVEMTVVLVILGLLIGGILAGQQMQSNAKLRSVATQASEYIQAIGQFQSQYQALPGDMTTATRLWGRADNDPTVTSNCAAGVIGTAVSAITAGATCNGNGDSRIGLVAADYYEIFRAWQHLKNAGFVKGSYSGVAGSSGTSQALVGTNIPASEYKKAGFDIRYIADGAIPVDYFNTLSYGHVLHFGEEVTGNNFAHGAVLSARQSYELDKKFDDNLPNTGAILSKNQAACVSATPAYLLGQTENKQCTLIFKTGF